MELNIPCECVLLEHFLFLKEKDWDFFLMWIQLILLNKKNIFQLFDFTNLLIIWIEKKKNPSTCIDINYVTKFAKDLLAY
jgi:hypothetical protein